VYVSLVRRSGLSSATLALGCVIALILGAVALAGTVGADGRWLAALGHLIVARHSIPSGVPFATEASAFSTMARPKIGTQLLVAAYSRLPTGTSRAAKPFEVYSRP